MSNLQEIKQKTSVGRPTVDTLEVRQKIEQAAAFDASVEEIAFFAGISRDTLWRILKNDREFSDRIKALRNKPILKARQTVVKKLEESYQNAMDYLSRKKKDEFSQRSEFAGADGKAIVVKLVNYGDSDSVSVQPKELSAGVPQGKTEV